MSCLISTNYLNKKQEDFRITPYVYKNKIQIPNEERISKMNNKVGKQKRNIEEYFTDTSKNLKLELQKGMNQFEVDPEMENIRKNIEKMKKIWVENDKLRMQIRDEQFDRVMKILSRKDKDTIKKFLDDFVYNINYFSPTLIEKLLVDTTHILSEYEELEIINIIIDNKIKLSTFIEAKSYTLEVKMRISWIWVIKAGVREFIRFLRKRGYLINSVIKIERLAQLGYWKELTDIQKYIRKYPSLIKKQKTK